MRGCAFWLALYLSLPSCAPPSHQQDVLGFPAIPPIANADPSIREEKEFLVATRLRIVRGENSISVEVDPDSLESITVDVGINMVAGFRNDQFIYRDGRLVCPGTFGLGGDWYFGTSTYHTKMFGFPHPGETYEIELHIQIFETDIPSQHLWMPESSKYRILWTRTLKQSA